MIKHTKPPWPNAILSTVGDTIQRYGMVRGGERVLVAVSGGPDSVALMHILKCLAPAFDLHLAAAHLNHGLRPRATDRDERHVIELTRQLGIECHIERALIQVPAGRSLEEHARKVRYEYLNRLADIHGYSKIAVGHQANDNAESVLLHLLRGSGIRGLGGIPPVRGNRIIRPLIHLHRNDILAYLKRKRIDYIHDESNWDPVFLRNRVRHQLIPLLESQYNPNIVATLNRTAELCHQEETWLRSELGPKIAAAIEGQSESGLTLRTEPLQNAPLALQRRILRDAIYAWVGHLRRVSADHIDGVIRLLPNSRIGKQLSLPFNVRVKRTAEHLSFQRSTDRENGQSNNSMRFQHVLETEGDLPSTLPIAEANIKLLFSIENPRKWLSRSDDCADVVWFDIDRLSFPLTVRSVLPGDRIAPFGMRGSQKIKKLFIDRKVPRDKRTLVPILLGGDMVLWIAGLRRCDSALITETTQRALKVQLMALD